MNSLAYLSRQFDVLASAKTPPSTPSSDRPSFIGDRLGKERSLDSELPRVNTWSTKSFLFPSSPNTTSTTLKRSFSSPAFASLKRLGLQSIPSSASPDVEARPWSKSQVEHIIRRIFFIRVFVLVWDNLRAAWLSLWKHRRLEEHPISISTTEKPLEAGEQLVENSILQPPSPGLPLPSASSTLPTNPSHISDPAQYASTELPTHSSTSPPTFLQSSELPTDASRSSTPSSGVRKTPFHLQKTLVLDLDETLIHSTSRPIHSSVGGGGFFGLGSFRTRNKGASHMVEVVLGGRSTLYHVYKRPFVDFFLRTVSGWYKLVIFTASMQEYADPVIDWLDAGRGILGHRFFRDSCTQLPNGSFTKNLSIVEADLSQVCLVDNSPISYRVNEANGIPIEGWTHDPSDEALLDLLPVLDSLRFTSDVRRVLGLRTAGGHGHS
ncbi:Nuclear envelope morphology protein 1 [Termitomyces sp. T112]|nr:Nuclear envelope morphology protein 1 [Termitomyces sp. T112]